MDSGLYKLKEVVDKLNLSNSNNDKLEVLKYIEDKQVLDLLVYTYSPFIKFHITKDQLQKHNNLYEPVTSYSSFISLLDDLRSRKITGFDAIEKVNSFIFKLDEELQEIALNVIDKNLKVRIAENQINKVHPNLIPEFKVQLANSYDDKTKKKMNFNNDSWLASTKLDGCRLVVIIDDTGKVSLYSRQGKEFNTLDILKKEIEKLKLKSVVFDGEIGIIENNTVNFQKTMKEIRKKDHQILNPKFFIFDYLYLSDFYKGESELYFSSRLELLKTIPFNSTYISILPQYPINSHKQIDDKLEEAISKGEEGLILKRDSKYMGKRTNDILKVKKFSDAEFVVKGIETGLIRSIVDGKDVEEELLSAVVIEYKNNNVSVGSGFSMEERRLFSEKPEEIIGKVITVNYFEESIDKDGNYSLRFPVVKVIHGKSRET